MRPSLNFTTASAVVQVGRASQITDISRGWSAAWVYCTNLSPGVPQFFYFRQAVSTAGTALFGFQNGGNLWCFIDTTTTDLDMSGSHSLVATNKWLCIAVVFDIAGGTTDQHIYVGDRFNRLTEISYATRTDPSGARVSDADGQGRIGNNALGTRTFQGRIAHVHLGRDRQPSVDELYQSLLARAPIPGTVALWNPGWQGAAFVADEVGPSDGRVSGPTPAEGLPLPYRYGMPKRRSWEIVAAATYSFPPVAGLTNRIFRRATPVAGVLR